jgi:hypothetical protein
MQQWIRDELNGINLGDKRLNIRCHDLMDSLAAEPDKSIPASLGGWSETKAAYRFFDNDKISGDKILTPHINATVSRIQTQREVLMIQDSTELDFTSHKDIEGLGVLGSSIPGYKSVRRGFMMHPTIAVTAKGLNLGVVHNEVLKRETFETVSHKKRSIESKQSMCWLNSFRHTKKLATEIPSTQFINIADRECDIYEYFVEYDRAIPNANFIVRSTHNRSTSDTLKVWDMVRTCSVIANIEFELPRGRGRNTRLVKQEIKISEVELISPKRFSPKLPNVKIYAVLASEIGNQYSTIPKSGERKRVSTKSANDKIEWLLLTTLPVNSKQDALTIIEYYLRRWQIELYFKILKSGCTIEYLQLGSYNRLVSCIAIYMIIAWRIQYITMLSRTAPDEPCNIAFNLSEWEAVYRILHRNKPPERMPTIYEMVRMIAQLGGFLGRKHDKEPGLKTIWIGMQKAKDYALAWEIFNQTNTCG